MKVQNKNTVKSQVFNSCGTCTTNLNLNDIPTELKMSASLVLWRMELRLDADNEPMTWPHGTRYIKVPYTVQVFKADFSDSESWTDFETASAALLDNAGIKQV